MKNMVKGIQQADSQKSASYLWTLTVPRLFIFLYFLLKLFSFYTVLFRRFDFACSPACIVEKALCIVEMVLCKC